MKGREHQVTRLRRLHRHTRSVLIADLANEHDVGILAQDRPQRPCERQFDLAVDLCLVDAWYLVLDGILDRDDVRPLGSQRGQRRAQRRGLAGSGRADNENHPVLVTQEGLQLRQRRRGEPECLEGRHPLAVVKDAEDDFLSQDRAQRGHPEIEAVPAIGAGANTTVLRQALLGDVEASHDLDASHEPLVNPFRQVHDLFQQSIQPMAYRDAGLGRLEVNVARPASQRTLDDQVDDVNDRCGI